MRIFTQAAAGGALPEASFFAFLISPGSAGLLAVVAAVIAFLASTRNARKERWWRRAEYALDRTLSREEAEQLVGLAMLGTLRSRDRREQDFIKAATDVFLDPEADGDRADDGVSAADAGANRLHGVGVRLGRFISRFQRQ